MSRVMASAVAVSDLPGHSHRLCDRKVPVSHPHHSNRPRGHGFQAQFHWHVEDRGIRHVYIKPRSPERNGNVERSHRSDQEEFYRLLTYKDDVDVSKKLQEWERYYNDNRPHGSFQGKTPDEALKAPLQ